MPSLNIFGLALILIKYKLEYDTIVVYCRMIGGDWNMMLFSLFGILTLVSLLIFLYSFRKDPRSMINGFLFNSLLIFFVLFCLFGYFDHHIQIFLYLGVLPFAFMVLILPFAFLTLIIGLIVNTRILMKKEGRRLRNALPLLIALVMIVFLLINELKITQLFSDPFVFFLMGIMIIIFYFMLHIFNFFTAYLLYQFNRPKLNQDYIIVLGSGLINDRVPPLLASRIHKAIDFYRKQQEVASPPTIIFSGGQGADENVSEGYAMNQYALSQGIPAEHTMIEDKSVNTYENMLFSKRMMDQQKKSYNSIFSTNTFHLFRAGLYAKKAGLNSQGIGSKTAWYFWPNAMIREYIAVLVMQKKQHLLVVLPITIISLLMSIIVYLFTV